MMNEWIYLAMSVSMGVLVVSYAYFTVNKHIATVERHEHEREARKRQHLKPAQ
jgi:accessory gene regulator protein AgrB